jgi:hypothetical protein
MAKTFNPQGREVEDLAARSKSFTPGRPHTHDLAGVKVGHVLLIADGDTGFSVTARLWDPPVPLGGGGVEQVTRPLRRPLTTYRGTESPGMVLSILLDGWLAKPIRGPFMVSAPGSPVTRLAPGSHPTSVEKQIRLIERMAGMFDPNDRGPVELIVASPSVPHCQGAHALSRRWIISDPPAWGDDPEVIRRSDGHRVRQQVTLNLLVSVEADELEQIKPRQPKPKTRKVHAKKGDTYSRIAKRELGTARLGRRLAKLNGARDPHKTLKEGTRVTLPSRDVEKDWKKELKRG